MQLCQTKPFLTGTTARRAFLLVPPFLIILSSLSGIIESFYHCHHSTQIPNS